MIQQGIIIKIILKTETYSANKNGEQKKIWLTTN